MLRQRYVQFEIGFDAEPMMKALADLNAQIVRLGDEMTRALMAAFRSGL